MKLPHSAKHSNLNQLFKLFLLGSLRFKRRLGQLARLQLLVLDSC